MARSCALWLGVVLVLGDIEYRLVTIEHRILFDILGYHILVLLSG